MKRKSLFSIFFIISLLLVSCNTDKSETLEDNFELEEEDLICEKISNMTLDEKIGQLMIIGYEERDIEENLEKKLKELKPGGVILFRKNVSNANDTLGDLNNIKKINKSYKNIPLFISVDEEGGVVSRMPDDMEKILDASTIGKIEDEEFIKKIGIVMGKNLKSLGYNMNFAPVLDININPNNKVIGSRSYGKDIETVINSGINIMKGLKEENIIPVVKHFPGHGDTEIDSHYNLPIVRKSLDELERFEIKPFKAAIENDVDIIMMAHILYPNIDKNPASISKVFINDILREKYKYDRVIISDDLTMGAITNTKEPDTAGVKFIQSGGDIALLAHGDNIGYSFREKIKESIDKGEISEKAIDHKVYRILSLKDKYEIDDILLDDIDFNEMKNETEKINKDIIKNKKEKQYIKNNKGGEN